MAPQTYRTPAHPNLRGTPPPLFYSGTKLATYIAALQLIDRGKLSVDDLVEDHVESIRKIPVLEGWDEKGDPIVRAPKTQPTILQLMTHTIGFGAEWLHEDSCRYRLWKKDVPPGQYMLGYSQYFKETVFLSDPGEKYHYGVGNDWLGLVIESISGMRLNDYIETNIFMPLNMHNSTIVFDPNKPHLNTHWRQSDGSLQVGPDVSPPPDFVPDVVSGGSYLLSTRDDYATLLLTLLNNGKHPHTGKRILSEENTQKLFEDQIPEKVDRSEIAAFSSPPSYHPLCTNTATLMEGIPKGWSLGLMTANKFDGANPGAGWAGLGNIYFWIDPQLGSGRIWLFVTNLLPFMDPSVLGIVDQLERATYADAHR